MMPEKRNIDMSGYRRRSDMEPFILEGMTLTPCYDDRLEEYGGCLDEDNEFQACEDCRLKAKCPINGDEED